MSVFPFLCNLNIDFVLCCSPFLLWMVWLVAIAFPYFFIVSVFSLLIKIAIIIKWVAYYFERIPIALNSSDL